MAIPSSTPSETYEVKPFGTGGHVILPKELVGRKVKITVVKRNVVFVRRPESALKSDDDVKRALWHYYKIHVDSNLVTSVATIATETLEVITNALGLDYQYKE